MPPWGSRRPTNPPSKILKLLLREASVRISAAGAAGVFGAVRVCLFLSVVLGCFHHLFFPLFICFTFPNVLSFCIFLIIFCLLFYLVYFSYCFVYLNLFYPSFWVLFVFLYFLNVLLFQTILFIFISFIPFFVFVFFFFNFPVSFVYSLVSVSVSDYSLFFFFIVSFSLSLPSSFRASDTPYYVIELSYRVHENQSDKTFFFSSKLN